MNYLWAYLRPKKALYILFTMEHFAWEFIAFIVAKACPM